MVCVFNYADNHLSDMQGEIMNESNVDKGRRRFLTAAATVVGGAGAAAGAVPFIATMTPSEKTKAIGAPVEVDISELKPGERMIKKWQGKPVWILRRTKEMLMILLHKMKPSAIQNRSQARSQNMLRMNFVLVKMNIWSLLVFVRI